MNLDRRNFLKVGVAAVAAGLASPACAREESAQSALDSPELLAMLGPDRVRRIGTDYRARVRSENSVRSLRAAISRSQESPLHLPWMHKSVEHTVKDDFSAGRIVVVDGWVLSLTEARQCALLSLAPT